ncbi:hypothetical protein CEXT_746791 [Caerostris extrusa]|uniref:Secreted protein n=1 Tax=Caerostris extrusa TaxID=172846 RepID=A0AAV4WXY3_CAEEX|nr:hypothetical protein CEXT_746791 [Caerostris extrusa]
MRKFVFQLLLVCRREVAYKSCLLHAGEIISLPPSPPITPGNKPWSTMIGKMLWKKCRKKRGYLARKMARLIIFNFIIPTAKRERKNGFIGEGGGVYANRSRKQEKDLLFLGSWVEKCAW